MCMYENSFTRIVTNNRRKIAKKADLFLSKIYLHTTQLIDSIYWVICMKSNIMIPYMENCNSQFSNIWKMNVSVN